MSTTIEVKLRGTNFLELKKAAEDFIAQNFGKGVSVNTTVTNDQEEEMESVQSPFTTATPAQATAPVELAPVGEVDAEGLPWDERIHASSKAKNANGTWRGRRNISDDTVAAVRLELRNRVATRTVAAPVVAPPPAAPAAPVVATAPVTAPVQVAPPAPALPTIAVGHTLETFKANFAQVIGSLIQEGKVSAAYVEQLKSYFGLSEIWMASDEHKTVTFNEFVKHNIIQVAG